MAVLLVAKANPRHIALVTGLALFSAVLVVATGTLAELPVRPRLTTFVDTRPGQRQPDDRGADPRSRSSRRRAIATGELTGHGFMQGPLTNGGYVPEQHTDFVFSAVGEQFGLLGCGGVLALYALLIVRMLQGGPDLP